MLLPGPRAHRQACPVLQSTGSCTLSSSRLRDSPFKRMSMAIIISCVKHSRRFSAWDTGRCSSPGTGPTYTKTGPLPLSIKSIKPGTISCYNFVLWGCQASTEEAGPGMRAERRRTRKLSANNQVPITLPTLLCPSLHKR